LGLLNLTTLKTNQLIVGLFEAVYVMDRRALNHLLKSTRPMLVDFNQDWGKD
jgi:hypothetical protein